MRRTFVVGILVVWRYFYDIPCQKNTARRSNSLKLSTKKITLTAFRTQCIMETATCIAYQNESGVIHGISLTSSRSRSVKNDVICETGLLSSVTSVVAAAAADVLSSSSNVTYAEFCFSGSISSRHLRLYISPHRQRQHHVNLLLLTDDETKRQHYVLISDLSRLVRGRTAEHNKAHVCPYCLHCFCEAHSLENHVPDCKLHSPQKISYPPPGEKVTFQNVIRTHKVPFALYCDFESYLQPVTDNGNIVNEHVPSGFCCLRVSRYPEYETPPVVYSGPGVMERFFQHLRAEKKEICRILGF